MLKRLFFFSVCLGAFACHADEVPVQAPTQILAAELKNFIDNDTEFKQRCAVEDDALRNLFDAVDRKMLIAQQEKAGRAGVLANFFYTMFPGAVLQQALKGLVYLSPEKIPHIQAVVNELAERYGMPPPPIFLAGDEKLFNALASSFTHKTAMIVLGRKLVEYMNDDELTSILAHELAHVKCGHGLKNMGAGLATAGAFWLLSWYVGKKLSEARGQRGGLFLKESSQYSPADFDRVVERRTNKNYEFYDNLATIVGFALPVVTGIAGVIAIAAMSRNNEQEADIHAMVATKNPDAFVSAMKSLSSYLVGQLTKFLDDYELLLKKIDELKAIDPEEASKMLNKAQSYGRAFVAGMRAVLEEEGGTHPSMKTRIAYGQLVCDHKDALEPKA